MTERIPMAEDMFEKARIAFFGTAKISTEQSRGSAELVNFRHESTPKEVTGPSSDEHEAT